MRKSIATYLFALATIGLVLLVFSGYGLAVAVFGIALVILPLALCGYAVLTRKHWASIPVATIAIVMITFGLVDIGEYSVEWINVSWIVLGVLNALIWLKIRKAFPKAKAK